MQFNPGDGTGCVDEVNDICNSDNNSYPLASKTRRVNQALDRFFTLAMQADGKWVYDDPSYGTDPIQTIDLVNGQQVYDIGTFASEVLYILRTEALDSGGEAHLLDRLDRTFVKTALTEYQNVPGQPTQYDLVGQSIYLYPEPNFDSTDSLKFYFRRNKVSFVDTDTTKTLPVPSLFVNYICRMVSLPYLIEYQKAQKNDIAALIAEDEQKIGQYFFSREESVSKYIRPAAEDNQ